MELLPGRDAAGGAARQVASVLGMSDAPALDSAYREASNTQRRGLRLAVALALAQDTIYALLFLAVLQTYLLKDLNAGAASPGYTIAVFSAVVLVTNPVAGALLDRTSTRLVLASAATVQVAAVPVLATVTSFGGVLAAAVLLGVGAGAAWPAVYHAVASTHPPNDRARASSTLALAGYGSTAIGLAVGVILASLANPKVGFIVAGAIALTPIALLRLSPPRAFESGMTRVSAGEHAEPRHSLALFAVVVFADYAAVAALAGVYGPYLELSLGLSLLGALPYLIPAALAALAALLLAPRVSRAIRRPYELGLLFALAAGGAAALAGAGSPTVAAWAAIPLAVGVAGSGPLIGATMLDLGAGSHRGLVFGSLMSLEGLGAVLGPAVAATANELAGPRAGFVSIGAVFGALIVVVLVAPSHRAN